MGEFGFRAAFVPAAEAFAGTPSPLPERHAWSWLLVFAQARTTSGSDPRPVVNRGYVPEGEKEHEHARREARARPMSK